MAKINTALNIGSLAAVGEKETEGRWIDIKHPAGGLLFLGGQTKQHLRIRVAGSYSKVYRDHQKRRLRTFTGDEDRDQAGLEALAVCTLEWDGAFDDNGKPIPFLPDNVMAVYATADFIFDQVDRETINHAAFFNETSGRP